MSAAPGALAPRAATAAGAVFAVAACLLWGLDVLVPVLLGGFGPAAITVSRFLCYGVVALVVLAARGGLRRVVGFGPRVLVRALLLGTLGEVVYYLLVVTGIGLVDAPVVAVIIGTLPVTVTLAGSYGGEFPLRRLAFPVALILLGVGTVNVVEIDWAAVGARSLPQQLAGVACAVAAVGLWTWFVVANARVLNRNPHIAAEDWSALLGVATFLPALLAAPFVLDRATVARGPLTLLAGGLVLGLAVSWLGTVFWNKASRGLPVSLLGQLMVFETLAALTYVFVATSKTPPPLELAGIAMTLVGLSIGIGRCRSPREQGKDPVDAPLPQ